MADYSTSRCWPSRECKRPRLTALGRKVCGIIMSRNCNKRWDWLENHFHGRDHREMKKKNRYFPTISIFYLHCFFTSIRTSVERCNPYVRPNPPPYTGPNNLYVWIIITKLIITIRYRFTFHSTFLILLNIFSHNTYCIFRHVVTVLCYYGVNQFSFHDWLIIIWFLTPQRW